MALVLLKEDGAGLAGANSYASAADGDAYHEGHLYASAWTAATAGQKESALVMATRLIDASYQFSGWRKSEAQALQWPRECAIDPDRQGVRISVLEGVSGPYFDSEAVPGAVLGAACELGRWLLVADRTVDAAGQGMKQLNLVGSLGITFDSRNPAPVLPLVVQTMLAKLGSLLAAAAGSSRLVRV